MLETVTVYLYSYHICVVYILEKSLQIKIYLPTFNFHRINVVCCKLFWKFFWDNHLLVGDSGQIMY